jgi:hypothetical protein
MQHPVDYSMAEDFCTISYYENSYSIIVGTYIFKSVSMLRNSKEIVRQ